MDYQVIAYVDDRKLIMDAPDIDSAYQMYVGIVVRTTNAYVWKGEILNKQTGEIINVTM
jgi:hypothetical protein